MNPRPKAETTVLNALSGLLREQGFERVRHDSPVAKEQARAMKWAHLYEENYLLVRSDVRFLIDARFEEKPTPSSRLSSTTIIFRVFDAQGRESRSRSFGFNGAQVDPARLREVVDTVIDAVQEKA